MTDDELDTFYKSEYRRVYQDSEGPVTKDLTVQEARAVSLINLMIDNGLKNTHRHLDIGSSSGLLMEKIRDKFHCQVVGIEPGDSYRIHAEERGLRVYATLEAAKEESPFNLITMVHVLEHVQHPVSFLAMLRQEYLTEDGLLLIEVPNLYAHDCFEVAHLVSFSRHTLFQVLKKAGYSTQVLQVHGQPRSNLIPLYITVIAAPINPLKDKKGVQKERWIGLKRRSGMTHRKIIERAFPRQAWLPEYRS
jgi:2-polyprenyl-3-methyl-5-hydroxy-6-metoxy-1,4-benzoquinol methylase